MHIPGERVKRTRLIQTNRYVVAVEVEMVIPYAPAPARIANQIYAQATLPKMIAQCTTQGKTIEQAMDWAASELEGFSRS